MASNAYRIDCTIVLQPRESVLSLSTATTSRKPLLQPHPVMKNRLHPVEHYDRLENQPRAPFFVAGVRNVLSNLRCIAISSEMQPLLKGRFATVEEECDFPGRPYHAICCRNNVLSIEEFTPRRMLSAAQPDRKKFDWIVTGTPVCWDCSEQELFDRMITDAADHAHVWHLPRGGHPESTPQSRSDWSRMQDLFRDMLPADRSEAARQLHSLATTLQLKREHDYLHSVWGVRDDGELVILIRHDLLENVGRKARQLGCRRAICVENSGSIGLTLVHDPAARPWLPMISAPNHRPAGTAFVFFSLQDARFRVLDQNGDP